MLLNKIFLVRKIFKIKIVFVFTTSINQWTNYLFDKFDQPKKYYVKKK